MIDRISDKINAFIALACKFTHGNLSGRKCTPLKSWIPIVASVITVTSVIIYLYYRSGPKKPDDSQDTQTDLSLKITKNGEQNGSPSTPLAIVEVDKKESGSNSSNRTQTEQKAEEIIVNTKIDENPIASSTVPQIPIVEADSSNLSIVRKEVDTILQETPDSLQPLLETFTEIIEQIPSDLPDGQILPINASTGDNQAATSKPKPYRKKALPQLPKVDVSQHTLPLQVPSSIDISIPPSYPPPEYLAIIPPSSEPPNYLLPQPQNFGPPTDLPPDCPPIIPSSQPPTYLPHQPQYSDPTTEPLVTSTANPSSKPPSYSPPEIPVNPISSENDSKSSSMRSIISKHLPLFSKSSTKVEIATEDSDFRAMRKQTLESADITLSNAKELFRFLAAEINGNRQFGIKLKKPKTLMKAAVSSAKALKNRSSTKKQGYSEAINIQFFEIKTAINKLIRLKKELKTKGFADLRQEERLDAALRGVTFAIKLSIEALQKTELLNHSSSLHENQKLQELIKHLTTKKVEMGEKKKLESTVQSWNEKSKERNEIFQAFIDIDSADSLKLQSTLSSLQPSQTDNFYQFILQLQTVSKNLSALAAMLQDVKVGTDEEKMTKLADIFLSETFQEYVNSVKEYLPYILQENILKSGIPNLTIVTSRLVLYPDHIREAIKLTPNDSEAWNKMLLVHKTVKERLQDFV